MKRRAISIILLILIVLFFGSYTYDAIIALRQNEDLQASVYIVLAGFNLILVNHLLRPIIEFFREN